VVVSALTAVGRSGRQSANQLESLEGTGFKLQLAAAENLHEADEADTAGDAGQPRSSYDKWQALSICWSLAKPAGERHSVDGGADTQNRAVPEYGTRRGASSQR
jgi:hypothetical protein